MASSRLSIGLKKTGFEDRQAAMVKTGSRHWKTVASISICSAGELENRYLAQPHLTHFSKTKVERKHGLERSQWASSG